MNRFVYREMIDVLDGILSAKRILERNRLPILAVWHRHLWQRPQLQRQLRQKRQIRAEEIRVPGDVDDDEADDDEDESAKLED